MKRLIATLAIYALSSGLAEAQVPTDFDEDGISDLTQFSLTGDSLLTWSAELSSTEQVSDLGTFGAEGSFPVLARWSGDKPILGVVVPNIAAGTLVWRAKLADASVERTFGRDGDLVVSGGDFNGDGKDDAAVVRLVNGKAEWEISYDLFDAAEGAATVTSVSFGKTGDRVFFARPDGGKADWAGVIGLGRAGRSVARMKNLVTGEVKQFARLPKFASVGLRPRPFAVPQEGAPDLLGFEIASDSSTTVKVYSLSGSFVGSKRFKGAGQSLVGDFDEAGGYEVAFQGKEESAVFNPVSGESWDSGYLGGTGIDETNLFTVLSATPTPTDNNNDDDSGSGGGGSGGGGGGSGGSGAPAGCTAVAPWPSTHIYKTVGSDHFTDIRRNTIGVILKVGARGPFPGCISAIDKNGRSLAALGLYQVGAGWAARYYAGVGCGASTPLNGSSVADAARRSSRSTSIYLKFDRTCYGPIEANTCRNSSSC